MKIQKAIKGSTGPIGDEVDRARDLISAGKSDGAIAAAISAARRHGRLPVHPQQIAQLRKVS